jgi:hypothetical protein
VPVAGFCFWCLFIAVRCAFWAQVVTTLDGVMHVKQYESDLDGSALGVLCLLSV